MDEPGKMTTEFSILNLDGSSHDPEETEVFFADLNLLQVIDRLTVKWGRDVRKYYLYFPKDTEAEAYRRAVYGDVKKDAVYRALMTYMERLVGIAGVCADPRGVSGQRELPPDEGDDAEGLDGDPQDAVRHHL